jgi:hypothetical protein
VLASSRRPGGRKKKKEQQQRPARAWLREAPANADFISHDNVMICHNTDFLGLKGVFCWLAGWLAG